VGDYEALLDIQTEPLCRQFPTIRPGFIFRSGSAAPIVMSRRAGRITRTAIRKFVPGAAVSWSVATASTHNGGSGEWLARIFHAVSTDAAQAGISTALRLFGRLDKLSNMSALPARRAPCIYARLRALDTKRYELSGLEYCRREPSFG